MRLLLLSFFTTILISSCICGSDPRARPQDKRDIFVVQQPSWVHSESEGQSPSPFPMPVPITMDSNNDDDDDEFNSPFQDNAAIEEESIPMKKIDSAKGGKGKEKASNDDNVLNVAQLSSRSRRMKGLGQDTPASPLFPSPSKPSAFSPTDNDVDMGPSLSFLNELIVIAANYKVFDRKMGCSKFPGGFFSDLDEVQDIHSVRISMDGFSNNASNAFPSVPYPKDMPIDVKIMKICERIIRSASVPIGAKAYILPKLAYWYDSFFYLDIGDTDDLLGGGTALSLHGNHSRGFEMIFYIVEAVVDLTDQLSSKQTPKQQSGGSSSSNNNNSNRSDSEINMEKDRETVKRFIQWFQYFIRPTFPEFGDLLASFSLYGRLVLGRSGATSVFGKIHGKGFSGNPVFKQESLGNIRGPLRLALSSTMQKGIGRSVNENDLTFIDLFMPLTSRFRKRWLQISLSASKFDELCQKLLSEMRRMNVTLDNLDSWDVWNQLILSKSKKTTLPSIEEYISAGVVPNLSEKLTLVSKLTFVQVGTIVSGLVPSGLGSDGTALIASTILSFLILFSTTCKECWPGYQDLASALNEWRASWFEGFLIARVGKSLHRSSLCTRSLLSIIILVVVYIYGLVASSGKQASVDAIFKDNRLSSLIYLFPLFLTTFLELAYSFFAYLLQVRDPFHLGNVWESLKEEEFIVRRKTNEALLLKKQ